jgi:hypothetical protein
MAEPEPCHRISVGICFSAKKLKNFGKFTTYLEEKGFKVVNISLESLPSEVELDIVLFKHNPSPQTALFELWASQNQLTVVDPPTSVLMISNREQISKVLADVLPHCTLPCKSFSVTTPNFAVLRERSLTPVQCNKWGTDTGLQFPVIAKPIASADHSLYVVFSASTLVNLPIPSPVLLQEYVPHSGCMFKVVLNYAIFTGPCIFLLILSNLFHISLTGVCLGR